MKFKLNFGRLKEKKYQHRLHKRTPVFIYQMGKVASMSIEESLKTYYKGCVIRSHTFEEKNQFWEVRQLQQYLKSSTEKPLKIISMVREPIERNVSAFFANFERDVGIPFDENKYTLTELRDVFLKCYDHCIPLEWFNKNIRQNFKINVFNHEFEFNKKHQIIKSDKIELLIFRHDLEHVTKEEIIKDFVNLPAFKLGTKNVSRKKKYGKAHSHFVKNVKFEKQFLLEMNDSIYTNHFYSPDEIDQLWERWSV